MLAIQSHKSRFYCIRWISFSLTITCSLKVLHETFFEPFGNPPEEQGGELSRLEGELSTFYKCFPVYIISFVSQARETFHIVEEILKSNKSWWNKIWLVFFLNLFISSSIFLNSFGWQTWQSVSLQGVQSTLPLLHFKHKVCPVFLFICLTTSFLFFIVWNFLGKLFCEYEWTSCWKDLGLHLYIMLHWHLLSPSCQSSPAVSLLAVKDMPMVMLIVQGLHVFVYFFK